MEDGADGRSLVSKRFIVYLVQMSQFTDGETETKDMKMALRQLWRFGTGLGLVFMTRYQIC